MLCQCVCCCYFCCLHKFDVEYLLTVQFVVEERECNTLPWRAKHSPNVIEQTIKVLSNESIFWCMFFLLFVRSLDRCVLILTFSTCVQQINCLLYEILLKTNIYGRFQWMELVSVFYIGRLNMHLSESIFGSWRE